VALEGKISSRSYIASQLISPQSSEDAASFERTLSTLTGKIARSAARNDLLRQRARRVRVMWTLYAGFAYILAALLLLLVTGWRSWGATEISVVTGGPVL